MNSLTFPLNVQSNCLLNVKHCASFYKLTSLTFIGTITGIVMLVGIKKELDFVESMMT